MSPFNFPLVGYQPQRFMGLFLQILFGANPAIKTIYEFLMVQFYKILLNLLAQICKNTVNLFMKKCRAWPVGEQRNIAE